MLDRITKLAPLISDRLEKRLGLSVDTLSQTLEGITDAQLLALLGHSQNLWGADTKGRYTPGAVPEFILALDSYVWSRLAPKHRLRIRVEEGLGEWSVILTLDFEGDDIWQFLECHTEEEAHAAAKAIEAFLALEDRSARQG